MSKEIEEIENRLEVEYHRGEIKDTPIINWRQALQDIQFLLSHISTLDEKLKILNQEMKDWPISTSKIQKYKLKHKYLANSPEYPCPYCEIGNLEEKVKELEEILDSESQSAGNLAEKLTDQMELKEQAESRLKRLQEAVDKHKWDKWGHYVDANGKYYYQVADGIDEELYKIRDEK